MNTSPKSIAIANKSRKISLTRAERAEVVRRRLFDAAIRIVGEQGYAEASVSRITGLADVAQGTFYNYFPSRQDLLDQLLPALGQEMLDFIKDRVGGTGPAIAAGQNRESMRFRAFFDFLIIRPQFMRILYEAALHAPKGYKQHMDNVTGNYIRALERDGMSEIYSPEELKVVAALLMGSRSYLGNAFAQDGKGVQMPPEEVFTAYDKLIGSGLSGLAKLG